MFAATGVGKSSLLRAGILPRLKDPTQEHLDVVYFRDWVDRPLAEFKRTALHVLQERGRLDAKLPLEDVDSLALKDFLQFCTLFTRPPLVVILDQFEEFFQYQRARNSFQLFIRQLTDVITDRGTAVALVISMREDFALELNAFKPYLPTLLFENFYRLEKLDRKNATDAIVSPIARVGFRYEDRLIDALLTDLVIREQANPLTTPVADLIESVEPPYLQITCSELWKIEQHNPEKTLRFETYKNKGGAQGLLKTYVENVLSGFSVAEKRLASLAFNHLITRRGTKMAYTAADLASLLGEDPQELGEVLERLSIARILRSQSRRQILWYELYHDLFSAIIETWNEAYKSKQRNKRAIFGAGLLLLTVAALYGSYDAVVNVFNYHLRLSVREVSDTLDLYRGKSGSLDILGLQRYKAETGYRRAQVEPDKLFVQRPVEAFDRINIELIGLLPLEERIVAYWKSGHHSKALDLAQRAISDDNVPLAQIIINRVMSFNSLRVFNLLEERLTNLRTTNLKTKVATAVGTLSIQQSADVLSTVLNHSDPAVRASAVEALGQLGSAQAIPALLERLNDSGNDVRRVTLLALGKIDPTRAREVATEVFTEPAGERRVKAMAAAILLTFDHQESLAFLSGLAGSGGVDDRIHAAEALGSFYTVGGTALLMQLLEDNSLWVKMEAVKSLGHTKATTAIVSLALLVTDSSLQTQVKLQRATVAALSQMATDDSLRELRRVVETPSLASAVRLAALAALGTSKTDIAVETILKAAEQNEDFLQLSAYKLFGERQLRQGLPVLRQHLTQRREQYDRWRRIRDTAREDFTPGEAETWRIEVNAARPASYWYFELAYAMARIDPENDGIDLLAHDLADVRHGAWTGLGEVGTVSLVQRLYSQRIKTKSPIQRHALYRAIDQILIWLEAVGSQEDLEALRRLLPQVQDSEEVVVRVEWTIRQLERLYSDASSRNVYHQN